MVSTSKYRGEFPKEAQNFKRGSGLKAIRDNGGQAKDPGREQNSGEAAKPHKGQSGPRGHLITRVREKAHETVRNSKVGAAVERPMPAGSVRTLQR
jgi:hypothetical protein